MSTQSPLSHVPTIALSTGKCGSRQPKYEPETLEALCASIEHWHENWEHVSNGDAWQADIYDHACALCGLFYSLNCVGCPVRDETGMAFCGGTPWQEVELEHETSNSPSPKPYEREYQFLVSLLPDKEEVV